MKLWKSKKPSSCVANKSAAAKNEDKQTNGNNIPLLPLSAATTKTATTTTIDRAMSPAQSEDSGLAPERGTTYATITLARDNADNLGITFAERTDLSYPPVIGALSPLGHAADFLAPGDRIHQIDGISTIGLTNQQVMNMLCNEDTEDAGGGGAEGAGNGGDCSPAIVEIEYSLPEYISQNSLCITSKLAQITVERESGCLGLTLRGGGDFPLIVTHVRPHGPVYKTGRIRPGDRLLRVDHVSLIGKTLAEAQQIIKCGGHVSGYTNLTIEYDVSVVQALEFSTGPLLIEIERPLSDKLGLVLCNYPTPNMHDASKIDEVCQASIYIASILPASIADRCGALTVGDKILAIDDNTLEDSAYTPDEAMTMLDTNNGRAFIQIQILPVYAMTRRGHMRIGSPKYGFSTMESRKMRTRSRFTRKSSLPLESGSSSSGPGSSSSGNSNSNSSASASALTTGTGITHAETFPVLLDCSQGSGILLGAQTPCGRAVAVKQVISDSVADRSGCIQKGDRIIAINKMYSLDVQTMRQLLGDAVPRPQSAQTNTAANWVELEIEFDMVDVVVPSSGVFNVKLIRVGKAGLGISVNGSSHGGFVIIDVKPGSPAHRTGSLRAGDILLAVDSHPVQHFNVESLLKEYSTNDVTTLTIKRVMLPDFLYDAQQKMPNHIYSNFPISSSLGSEHDLYSSAYIASKYAEVKYNDCISMKSTTPQPDYYRGPSMDEASLQSVQIRQHTPSSIWLPPNSNSTMGRSFGGQNTQSLTAELEWPDDDNNFHEFGNYDLERFASIDCTNFPPPMESKVYGSAASTSSKSSGSSLHQIIFTVRLEPKGGLLGITLAGSEDITKPITISGIVEGGIAYKSGQLKVGDHLLAINEDSIQGLPLSQATDILQNLDDVVHLKILRAHDSSYGTRKNMNPQQPQAIYAQVQRRARSPSSMTEGGSSVSGKKHCIYQVTLYKDKVYDDYGFSVSDGLYERGVFINRIRTGGPADVCGMLKPYDRIIQVNDMKTVDFDCCLTVPLIAAAGDKIDLTIQRVE